MPELVTKEHCTGCTACSSVCPNNCISMIADQDGFLFPNINTNICVECGLCEKICPIKTPLTLFKNDSNPNAFAAYSKNIDVRLNSSSGGIFSEIAKDILKHNGVVYGATYDENFNVVHICVENEIELEKLRGAKYAQSNLKSTFKDIKKSLENDIHVLFSGTPCQVEGLKSFLQKDYNNLICIDFICLSVPSPLVWNEYVKYRAEIDNNKKLPESINLRSKITGWSNYSYSNIFRYDCNNIHTLKSSNSPYMKLFGGGYISRKSCENCKFKNFKRNSDITIGDFWGIWDLHPEMDDNNGTSVIITQSSKGEKLLNNIINHIVIKSVTLDDVSYQNKAIIQTITPNKDRDKFLSIIKSGNISDCIDIINNNNNNNKSQTRKYSNNNIIKIIYNKLFK